MRFIRLGVLVALVGVVCLASGTSLAGGKGGSSAKGGFHGKVTNIHLTNKTQGTIRVKELKPGAGKVAVEKTFRVDGKTKIKGAKKGGARMTLDHLEVGHDVTIHGKGDHAHTIQIKGGKK